MNQHIVLTLGRSGSNTLCDMLNQHPAVLNIGEVLGEWSLIRKTQNRLPFLPKDDEEYVDWVLHSEKFRATINFARSAKKVVLGLSAEAKPLGNVETFGIKEFSSNFLRSGLAGYVSARPKIRVVGLLREDVVGRMVSFLLLRETKLVKATRVRAGDQPTIRINPEQLSDYMTAIELENTKLEEMLHQLPESRKIVVRYADLYSDQQKRDEIMAEVFNFLEVSPIRTRERMVKLVRVPISEVIENYADCLAAVVGTRFEELLREADG